MFLSCVKKIIATFVNVMTKNYAHEKKHSAINGISRNIICR